MSQIPNLDNAPINLSLIRDKAQEELIDALDSVKGKKVLYLDPKLSGPLALIAQTSLLKEHGVENLFHLAAEPVQSECRNVMYLVRPRVSLMKTIAEQIRHDKDLQIPKNYSIYFMPRITRICQKILEANEVLGDVTLREFPLYFIPFDEDVLSLELDTAYKEYRVEGDTSALWYVARAISNLQLLFGVIPNVKAKGKAASQVAEMLKNMHKENPGITYGAGIPEIDTVILLDRHVDMVTPMCSQLTYEGLLDEFLHINNGTVEVDSSIILASSQNTKKQVGDKKIKVPLNSSDKLYRELRDLNFGVVGQVLQRKTTTMKNDYAEVTTMSQSVSELKDFVKKLNILPEITRHVSLAQHLSATYTNKQSFLDQLHIEQTLVEGINYDITSTHILTMIYKQEPLVSVLRLLIMLSLTSGGLKPKDFDNVRRELLHSYGFEYMSLLSNLEKAGLLKKQGRNTIWPPLIKALKLVVEDVDDANPNDIAYVFSGYAPLSVRIVENCLKRGWRAIEGALKLLPGSHLEWSQETLNVVDPGFEASGLERQDNSGVADGRRSLVLVVFIGGVTFAEISALRFLSAQEGMKYDLIVATTKLINGTTLLETLIDDPTKD
ncbi:hypothetical protein KP509_21G067400 [Ceratopteris richardii]|uniref:Uncharacterized protein n=1 Tax=Ceratopteris richardii TaxID=49495 RepID=A0A8T2SEJ5_CERRI|nr:hypothetical protein KP509_21G067400 [Ceratopteris richardii]